jgi:DNA-binding transcriptional regulator YiaG
MSDETKTAAEWDAERVRELRRHLGESQAAFAERIGTRQQTVSEWETGSSTPRRMSRRLLHLIAEEHGFYDVHGGESQDAR